MFIILVYSSSQFEECSPNSSAGLPASLTTVITGHGHSCMLLPFISAKIPTESLQFHEYISITPLKCQLCEASPQDQPLHRESLRQCFFITLLFGNLLHPLIICAPINILNCIIFFSVLCYFLPHNPSPSTGGDNLHQIKPELVQANQLNLVTIPQQPSLC